MQAQLDQLELAGKRQDLIVGAIDPIVAQAREMKNHGASDLDIKAFITQQMPQAVQGLRDQLLPGAGFAARREPPGHDDPGALAWSLAIVQQPTPPAPWPVPRGSRAVYLDR